MCLKLLIVGLVICTVSQINADPKPVEGGTIVGNALRAGGEVKIGLANAYDNLIDRTRQMIKNTASSYSSGFGFSAQRNSGDSAGTGGFSGAATSYRAPEGSYYGSTGFKVSLVPYSGTGPNPGVPEARPYGSVAGGAGIASGPGTVSDGFRAYSSRLPIYGDEMILSGDRVPTSSGSSFGTNTGASSGTKIGTSSGINSGYTVEYLTRLVLQLQSQIEALRSSMPIPKMRAHFEFVDEDGSRTPLSEDVFNRIALERAEIILQDRERAREATVRAGVDGSGKSSGSFDISGRGSDPGSGAP